VRKDPRVYLARIIECIEQIVEFTRCGREEFMSERMTQDATIHNLEIIDRVAARLDDSYRASQPQIPWLSMDALHEVLLHQDEGIDLAKIWSVVSADLPPLHKAIAAILPPLDQLERELAGED
jgi:uncharacterized protein with HEPN domain